MSSLITNQEYLHQGNLYQEYLYQEYLYQKYLYWEYLHQKKHLHQEYLHQDHLTWWPTKNISKWSRPTQDAAAVAQSLKSHLPLEKILEMIDQFKLKSHLPLEKILEMIDKLKSHLPLEKMWVLELDFCSLPPCVYSSSQTLSTKSSALRTFLDLVYDIL